MIIIVEVVVKVVIIIILPYEEVADPIKIVLNTHIV